MSTYKNLMTVCAAVVLAFGLAACGSSNDDSMAEAPVVKMPEPTPDPVPTDLEATQTAAAAAAAAAMTASASADTAASGAEDATANIATLQTNGTAAAAAYGAHEAAVAAAAEAAWAIADAAQTAAEAAETTATEMAMAAIEAAAEELHINVTVKNLGDSTVDATAGALTDQEDGTMTGFIESVSRDVAAIEGEPFDQRGILGEIEAALPEDERTTNTADVEYVQAVMAASVDIGKVLDTSDDLARLTIITAREGKEDVRVFADMVLDDTAGGLLDNGLLEDIDTVTEGEQTASAKSIGSFYMATPSGN